MLTRFGIAVVGVVIASAVAALPYAGSLREPHETGAAPSATPEEFAPLATKGDRLRILGEDCATTETRAPCADIYWPATGPSPARIFERRVGEAGSVLIRIPLSAASPD